VNILTKINMMKFQTLQVKSCINSNINEILRITSERTLKFIHY